MTLDILPDLNCPVGQLASARFCRLRETDTVGQAVDRLREEPESGRSRYIYVTDSAGRLTGVLSPRRLVFADPSAFVAQEMTQAVCALGESETFGAAFEILAELRLRALPVVDARRRLVGVIDVSAITKQLLEMERAKMEAGPGWSATLRTAIRRGFSLLLRRRSTRGFSGKPAINAQQVQPHANR